MSILNFFLINNVCQIINSHQFHPICYVNLPRFDPHATQFITFSQMSDFIGSLDPPLGIPKPNSLAIVSFDLPIAKVNSGGGDFQNKKNTDDIDNADAVVDGVKMTKC